MKSFRFVLPVILFCLTELHAQESLLGNAYMRASTSLDGEWKIIIDPYENGYYDYRHEAFDTQQPASKNAYFTNSKPKNKSDLVEYDFDASESLQVPGDWNTQMDKLLYYEGTVWYKKSFDYHKPQAGKRVFVYFGAVNYRADVYLNGQKLGTHIGGFTPFNYEITDLLKEKGNFLILKVDNTRKKEAVPTLNTDWWNYGGITRSVELIETSGTFIRDFSLQLNPENQQELIGSVTLDGPDKSSKNLTLSVPELKLETSLRTDVNGKVTIKQKVSRLDYWSPQNPHLYKVILSTAADTLTDKVGLRTIQTRGNDILLNGKPVFLKGISIHEESPLTGGRANSKADAELLLGWVKELNANFVRLAHYPHNEHMVRLADEMGILVWEENPVYWTIQWDNPETYANAQKQLTDLITRDKNRASVIIWSMANETPTSAPRLKFLNKLASHARELDRSRLLSAALEQSTLDENGMVRTINDPFAATVDILSFNQYIGWYDGLPAKTEEIRWQISQQKPILISEFGAGAKYGYHGDRLTRWSEEYQEYLYQETLKMLDKIKQLRGMSPWLLMDFRSPRRPLAGIQDGYNRKGLIDEKGHKKAAFYVLQKYYAQKAPD